MFVVIVRKRALFWVPILVFLTLGGVLTILAWLIGPAPAPRLGLASACPHLARGLFPGYQFGEVILDEPSRLL